MFQLRRLFEVDVTVGYQDDAGNQAQVEGDPLWSSSNTDDLAIVATADPFTVTVQALGPVGSMPELTVEADADLGAGVVPIIASEQISIVSGQATTASFTVGEPRPIG